MRFLRSLRPPLILAAAVGLLAVGLRLFGIGQVLTVDESEWIFRSQRFVASLHNGDPGGTFQGTHPGVVPMLLIGSGLEARSWWTGEHLVSPIIGSFRTAAKIPMAIAMSVLVACSVGLAQRLWGMRIGLSAGLFLATEPVLVGYSQVAHLDALLAGLMGVTLLLLLLYRRTERPRHLIAAGVCMGLALLTKLPAVVLLPAAALTLWQMHPPPGRMVQRWLGCVGVAAVVGVLLWPSLWTHTLPNAVYLQRDVQAVMTQAHGEDTTAPAFRARLFYFRTLLTVATPASLALAVAGAWAFLRGTSDVRRDGILLLATSALFLGLLTFVEKRGDRYVLPVIAIVDVLAGIGVGTLVAGLRRVRPWFPYVVPAFCAMAVSAAAPAALGYRSPLQPWDNPTQIGWGEGLEMAAAWLNQHPLAPSLQVASWYPNVFREFFRGHTLTLSSRHDARVDAVVLYRNMRGRAADSLATQILEEYRDKKPDQVVSVHGTEMVWIYLTDSVDRFPVHVGELVGGVPDGSSGAYAREAGEILPVPHERVTGVRMLFATFSSRPTSATVVLHVREQPDSPDLRTVTVPAASLVDREWRTFTFDPIEQMRGKTLYVAVTSPDGMPRNAVTVLFQEKNLHDGTFILVRRPLRAGEERKAFVRSGDLAVTFIGE